MGWVGSGLGEEGVARDACSVGEECVGWGGTGREGGGVGEKGVMWNGAAQGVKGVAWVRRVWHSARRTMRGARRRWRDFKAKACGKGKIFPRAFLRFLNDLSVFTSF